MYRLQKVLDFTDGSLLFSIDPKRVLVQIQTDDAGADVLVQQSQHFQGACGIASFTIHNQDIRLKRLDLLNRLLRVSRLAHDFQRRFLPEETLDAPSEKRMTDEDINSLFDHSCAALLCLATRADQIAELWILVLLNLFPRSAEFRPGLGYRTATDEKPHLWHYSSWQVSQGLKSSVWWQAEKQYCTSACAISSGEATGKGCTLWQASHTVMLVDSCGT